MKYTVLIVLVIEKGIAVLCTESFIFHWQICNKIVKELKTNLITLAILFHFLCAQHVSDINISIIRSFRLFCWITTLVVLFLVRCVLEFRCGWVGVVSVLQASACFFSKLLFRLLSKLCFSLQHGYHSNPTTPKLQHTSNKEQYEQCGNSTE